MLVAVASTRPAKVEACRRAFTRIQQKFWPERALSFRTFSVPSGVPDMPKSLEELALGAKNRALNLVSLAPRADFFVGLEGGFFRPSFAQEETETFLQGWAFVYNGKIGFWGASYAAPVPAALSKAVYEKGLELGDIIDAFSGRQNVRDNEGAFGVFTEDILTRADSFEKALLAALAPFYNPFTYQKNV